MTITATAMPLLGISTSLVCSSSSFPSDRVALGAGDGQKGDAVRGQPAPPIVNLGRNVSSPYRTQRRPKPPCDFNRWIPAQEAAARSASAASGSTSAIMMRTRISCMSLNIGRRARSAALVKRGDEAVLPRDCAIILCHIRRYNTRYAIIRRISL
jgi:hypothetical protein